MINHVVKYAAQPTSTCLSWDMYEHLAITASAMTEQSFFTFPFFKFPKPIRKFEKYLIPFFFLERWARSRSQASFLWVYWLGVREAIRFFVSNRLRCLFNSKQSFLIFHWHLFHNVRIYFRLFLCQCRGIITKLKCELIGAEVRGLFIRLALPSRPALYCNNILNTRFVYL